VVIPELERIHRCYRLSMAKCLEYYHLVLSSHNWRKS
jgi:hypothetical protein